MVPFATMIVAFTLLLAARIKPCGIAVVLVASLAIVAIEVGARPSHPRHLIKISHTTETEVSHVHRS